MVCEVDVCIIYCMEFIYYVILDYMMNLTLGSPFKFNEKCCIKHILTGKYLVCVKSKQSSNVQVGL